MRRALLALIIGILAATAHAADAGAGLAGLPLVEVPATGAGGDTLAVLLSGDGGWVEFDADIAKGLAAHGIRWSASTR